MKILIIGDIYGQAGKSAIQDNLPEIIKQYLPDIVIANGENVSKGGKSLDKKDYIDLMQAGIQYFTMGNHTFKRFELETYIDKVENVIRPGNAWSDKKGKSYLIIPFKNKKILLFNLLGQSFMPGIDVTSPFEYSDNLLSSIKYDLAILDFHAEATAEKIVLANYLSDRVGIFFGTHTHIQTADERILNGTTAYITDVGMTGVFDSAIGADFSMVTSRMKDNKFGKFLEAKGNVRINAILVTLDDKTLIPFKIERIILDT